MVAAHDADERPVRVTVTVHQNQCRSPGDDEMTAVLVVRAVGTGTRTGTAPGGPGHAAPGPGAVPLAVVFMVDCSGSMGAPQTKMAAARRATCAAIDTLRDGTLFAVVEGTDLARMAYPAQPRMAVADARTRAEATRAVAHLDAVGGTRMGRWLSLADELLAGQPAVVRHAVLLTDGRNQHESAEQLDAVLDACAGRFGCDARGIGDDWEPRELLRIASVLRGGAEAVRSDGELVGDFTAMVRAAQRKQVGDLRLRITTRPPARVRYLKQFVPNLIDLTEHANRVDERTVEFGTGSWADETREFLVSFAVDCAGAPMDEQVRVARVDVLAGDDVVAVPQSVAVQWTEDVVASSRIEPHVAHHTRQEELSRAVEQGCDALQAGRRADAETHLGRAVQLATALGNREILKRLGRLVEVTDAAAGQVRVKAAPQRGDLLSAAVSSIMSTSMPQPADAAAAVPAGPDRVCGCGRISPGDATVCMACGQPLDDPVGR